MNQHLKLPPFSQACLTTTQVGYARVVACSSLTLLFLACSPKPQSGPDKTLVGAAMGAAWGAGAGAVVGNQVSATGEGLAVGAGLGALSGAMTGAGFDVTEGQHLELSAEMEQLKAQNAVNSTNLMHLQRRLDNAQSSIRLGVMHKVLFDPDVTSLRVGAIKELEAVAEQLRKHPGATDILVRGHADDDGTPEYNERIAEARARSVAAFLISKGISSTRIAIESSGSKEPLASNVLPEGRQINRRVEVILR